MTSGGKGGNGDSGGKGKGEGTAAVAAVAGAMRTALIMVARGRVTGGRGEGGGRRGWGLGKNMRVGDRGAGKRGGPTACIYRR